MPDFPTVRVNAKAVGRIHSGHVWIFASDVLDRGDAQPGDAVRIVDPRNHVLGVAHFSSSSQISLRLLSRRVEAIDADFLLRRIQAAHEHRLRVVRDSNAYRLVHAEGDLLPGLVVDRYGDYLVVQLLDQGMDRLAAEITGALNAVLAPKGILARNDIAVRAKEGLPLETRVLSGEVPPRAPVGINGLLLEADLFAGQKTGVFLDQRENYLAAQVTRMARTWPRARLLHRLRRLRSAPGFGVRFGRGHR